MDIQNLKQYIYENDKIEDILINIGCHHIKETSDYFKCANPDGQNPTAITVYKSEQLSTINYTRNISKNNGSTDIISLVEYAKDINFFDAIKYICGIIGLDIYHDFSENIPESLQLTKLLFNMIENNDSIDEEKPLKPISENILSYYLPYSNTLFEQDNISTQIQKYFEIGYDDMSKRITIPIRDEYNNLIGVKGRFIDKILDNNIPKYLALEKYAKSQILYGLNKSIDYIKQKQSVIVVESEKAVMQLFDAGICNCVATGGSEISKSQIEKLTRLCVPIIFAYDKDINIEKIKYISKKFLTNVEIYVIIDTDNILKEKESPTDNIDKFKMLFKNNIIKLERGEQN